MRNIRGITAMESGIVYLESSGEQFGVNVIQGQVLPYRNVTILPDTKIMLLVGTSDSDDPLSPCNGSYILNKHKLAKKRKTRKQLKKKIKKLKRKLRELTR